MEDIENYIWEKELKRVEFKGKVMNDKQLKAISNQKALSILKVIYANRGITGNEIAHLLKEDVFSVYYYLRKLEKAGIIDVEEHKKTKNFAEKRYYLNADAFVWFVDEENLLKKERKDEQNIKGVIIVGSPDPHGKFNLKARDGYLAGKLAHFLGKLGWDVEITLDTLYHLEIDHGGEYLFLIGGPLINVLFYEVNEEMMIFYDKNVHYRGITSNFTKRTYSEENVSLLSKIKRDGKQYVILSGVNLLSTEIAITAFKDLYKNLLYHTGDVYYLIEGIDKDNDGRLDHYNIIEEHFL